MKIFFNDTASRKEQFCPSFAKRLVSIVLYNPEPTACWSPMPNHFPTRWVSRLLGLA